MLPYPSSYKGALLKTLILPLLLFSLLFELFYQQKLDFVLADWWYQLQGGQWALQHHWLMQSLLHDRVRDFNLLLVLALLGYALWLRWGEKASLLSHALWTLLYSVLSCFALVSLLKHVLPMECPWDLLQFGGDMPFYGLLQQRPDAAPVHLCFPAGHASIGFAWLGLYYFFLDVKPQWAKKALAGAALTGALLGAVQQSRGAHFFSHDIFTAALCWTVCTAIYYIRRSRPKAKARWVGVDHNA